MKMIPISEIDSLITGLENKLYEWRNFQVVELLKEIKQKAIPSIPISKIDEKIKEYQKRNVDIKNSSMCIPEWLENNEIRILALEDLKE